METVGSKMKQNAKKLISVVIPAKNEEKNIVELRTILDGIAAANTHYNFEFLLIDNHSEDKTEELLRAITREDKRWKYIRFSRNFFLESSLAAGLTYCTGDAAIILFSDLQDPPELIPTMIGKWEEGYDVVYGQIRKRSDHNVVKKIGSLVYHKIIHRLSNKMIPENSADFQLLSRRVIDAILKLQEKNRNFRGIAHWSGFRKFPLPYDRKPRRHGKTTSNVLYAATYAIESITSFSQVPLRIASIFGLFVTSLSVLAMIVYTIIKVFNLWIEAPPVGSTTLVLIMFFFGGIQSFFLGIIGEYIGRIFVEVKNRPLWIIESQIGLDQMDLER